MVTYEVTAIVEPALVGRYEDYMRGHHVPDVLASGCFLRAVFTRAAPGHYRIRYDAATGADLERYRAIHAPALREDFVSQFPEGVVLTREVWTTIQSWDSAAG